MGSLVPYPLNFRLLSRRQKRFKYCLYKYGWIEISQHPNSFGKNREIQFMGKSKDAKKESKKAPQKTAKEKKEAKRAKKAKG